MQQPRLPRDPLSGHGLRLRQGRAAEALTHPKGHRSRSRQDLGGNRNGCENSRAFENLAQLGKNPLLQEV